MKDSKFSDAQKAFILKQGADGIPVAEICRRAGKDGGLGQILQRGSTERGHRQQATDPAAESRRHDQPVAVIEGRKLYLPALQQTVSDQKAASGPKTPVVRPGGMRHLRTLEHLPKADFGSLFRERPILST